MNKKNHFASLNDAPTSSFSGDFTQQQKQEQPKGRALTTEEERKKQDGFALQEMMKSAGWSIVEGLLQDMPKGHVDPRGMKQDEWVFAELNAFHSGNVAAELLRTLQQVVSDSQTLQQIELGEIQETRPMRI